MLSGIVLGPNSSYAFQSNAQERHGLNTNNLNPRGPLERAPKNLGRQTGQGTFVYLRLNVSGMGLRPFVSLKRKISTLMALSTDP